MIVIPAMDLMGGRPVRLSQGRFDDSVTYGDAPVDAVLGFERAGAEYVHIVDLDGARAGEPRQHGLIADIALSVSVALQVAGGFREEAHLARLFDAGVDRIVIGSLAVKQPNLVRGFIERFGPERITLALDVHIIDEVPFVAISGWTERSQRSLWDVAEEFPGARHLLVTDIGRDGMLTGPNVGLIEEIGRRLPHLSLQASGGVSSLDDLDALAGAGADRVIIGKALWEGRFTLEQALTRAGA